MYLESSKSALQVNVQDLSSQKEEPLFDRDNALMKIDEIVHEIQNYDISNALATVPELDNNTLQEDSLSLSKSKSKLDNKSRNRLHCVTD